MVQFQNEQAQLNQILVGAIQSLMKDMNYVDETPIIKTVVGEA